MATAAFNGRMQKLTLGRIADIVTTHSLACNPNHDVDSSLMLFKDGEHTQALDRIEELQFLGNLDGIIIGIGGADPPAVHPEQILPQWADAAERFFNPERNPMTYFERMLLIKDALLTRGIPAPEFDCMPKFPHHFYPSSEGLFEPAPKDFAFQYLGIEVDRHFQRVLAKGPEERNIIILYHDYRGMDLPDRERPLMPSILTPERNPFLLYAKRFIPPDDGTVFGRRVEDSLDVMFEDAVTTDSDAVLAIVCFPRQSDRKAATQRWGRPFHDVMPLTPFQTYMRLKDYIIQQGVDLRRTHITFLPPDIVLGTTPSRSDHYLPGRFTFYSEDLGDANPTIRNKNEKFSAHPNCVSLKYTN